MGYKPEVPVSLVRPGSRLLSFSKPVTVDRVPLALNLSCLFFGHLSDLNQNLFAFKDQPHPDDAGESPVSRSVTSTL